MRHVITVVGSLRQAGERPPSLRTSGEDDLRETNWYACNNQDEPQNLLDDTPAVTGRLLRAPVLAYQFYLLVHNTKLWSGKRPLILIRGRSLSSRVAAYAGTWGGGDVVKADDSDEPPLGPTRYLLQADGGLELRTD
jgi:hypothetical protein